jgi:hypothetical protein
MIGIFRQLIANIGIAMSVVFSRVNLPVYVMMDEIPDSLLSSLETRGMKSSIEGLAQRSMDSINNLVLPYVVF